MKKIMLIAAAALFIGATAANAQDPTMDTTKNPRRSTQQSPQQQNPQQSSDKMNKDKSSDAMGAGERTLVRSSEIPAGLRQSLQSSEYTGWESSRIYRTKNGEYLVEIKNNGATKTHRFDANGKPIKE
jgi:hypothetical protein